MEVEMVWEREVEDGGPFAPCRHRWRIYRVPTKKRWYVCDYMREWVVAGKVVLSGSESRGSRFLWLLQWRAGRHYRTVLRKASLRRGRMRQSRPGRVWSFLMGAATGTQVGGAVYAHSVGDLVVHVVLAVGFGVTWVWVSRRYGKWDVEDRSGD